MRAVQPVFHERFAGRAFALGDFVLVMREFQILAAEVQVETFAEHFHAHGAALDVPAGPAFAERTRPENIAIVRHARFPEREVGDGFLFVFIGGNAFAGAHLVEIQFQQLAVIAAAALIFGDGKINRAVVRFVGDAARDELFDERDDFGDVFGGARFDVRFGSN